MSIGLVHVAKGNESIRMDCFVTCRRPLRRSHMKFPSCFCSSLSSASFFDEKFDALLFSLDLIGSHWISLDLIGPSLVLPISKQIMFTGPQKTYTTDWLHLSRQASWSFEGRKTISAIKQDQF